MPNIEEQLRKAIEEGKFDDLPGKGKPLHLDEINPHADSDWELAYHIIKEGGFTLPWIETIREIEKDIETARKELQRAWKWHGDLFICGCAGRQSPPLNGSEPKPASKISSKS